MYTTKFRRSEIRERTIILFRELSLIVLLENMLSMFFKRTFSKDLIVLGRSLVGLNPRESCISSAHCVELLRSLRSSVSPVCWRRGAGCPLAARCVQARPSQDTTENDIRLIRLYEYNIISTILYCISFYTI